MSEAVCTVCKGELWLCEDHPRDPWPHCASAGMPCVCNPAAIMPHEYESITESETYSRMMRTRASDKPR